MSRASTARVSAVARNGIKTERTNSGQTDPAGVIDCYHVVAFTAAEGRNEIRPKVEKLLAICQRAMANIDQWDDAAMFYSIVFGPVALNIFETTSTNAWLKRSTTSSSCRTQPQNFDLASSRPMNGFSLR
jgi:hypothetical protein